MGDAMTILNHNITTTNIRFHPDNPSLADDEAYVQALHQIETGAGKMDLLVGGRYLDRYEKCDEQWKLSYRPRVTGWAHVHEATQINLKHPLLQGLRFGQKTTHDPRYSTLSLFERDSCKGYEY